MLYVDDSDESETYRAAGTRNTKRKPDGKADFEGIGSMWSQSTNDALKKRGKADLDAITGSLFKPGIRQCVYAIAATHHSTGSSRYNITPPPARHRTQLLVDRPRSCTDY